MNDEFIVGVVRGGSLAHLYVGPVFVIWGLLAGSPVTVLLGLVCALVGGYIRWASRDWEIDG